MTLEMRGVQAAYGLSQILFGVDLVVPANSVVTLLGRNGMGKSTTVKTIMGIVPLRAGAISFETHPIGGRRPFQIARAGIALVPEGRHIFPNLTVAENLVATAANRRSVPRPWSLERVYEMFPRLEERRCNMGAWLSGGEQQMLAIGRALMTNPTLLILDEATEGLAPRIREEIWRCIELLRQTGLAILVIDKNLEHLLRIADRHYILNKGRVVWQGSSQELAGDVVLQQRMLGI